MGKEKLSIKICEVGREFLKNLKKNRIKTDVDEDGLSYWELIKLISNYFKQNNSAYLELVKMEHKK